MTRATEHMTRVSQDTLIAFDQLKTRLQALSGRRDVTRDDQFRVALAAAENTPDEILITYLPERDTL